MFVIVPSPRGRDSLHSKVVSNIQEIRARGARTLVIAEDGDEAVLPYADEVFYVPQSPTLLVAAADRGAAADLRVRAGHRQGARRRPAPQPREVRHGRVTSASAHA